MKTNRAYLIDILDHEIYRRVDLTHFLAEHMNEWTQRVDEDGRPRLLAAVVFQAQGRVKIRTIHFHH